MFGNSKEQIESLKKELTDISLYNERLEKRNEANEASIESFALIKQEYENKISKYILDIENLKGQQKVELELKDKSINRKINSALAAVGVSTFALDTLIPSEKNLSDKDALNKFQSLTGEEKTEFYKNNKEKIARALLL